MKISFAHIAVILVLADVTASTAASSRFTLATQSDWNARHGFYIDFENDAGADGTSKLSTLKLDAGIADGTNWKYILGPSDWSLGREYDVDLKVGNGEAELFVDGKSVGKVDCTLAAQAVDVQGSIIPDWARAPADYNVVQTRLEIDDDHGTHAASIPPPSAVMLFNGGASASIAGWRPGGAPFTVHVAFRLDPPADNSRFYPLVDRYGQPTFADYGGKVKSDDDLKAAIDREKRHEAGWASVPFNRYGGELHPAWTGKVTGYYHVARHNGFNWLIDPTGAPVFYTGICTVAIPSWEATPVTGRESIFSWLPQKNTEFAPAIASNIWGSDPGVTYASFVNANLIRKYGKSWIDTATDAEKRRARDWGFSGFGKWTTIWDDAPSIPVLSLGGVPILVRHPDIFDPRICAQLKDQLASQIDPHLHSPFVVGWSFGNEYDEIITTDEIKQILKKPADTPSRKALVDFAVDKLYGGDASKIGAASDADIERMRRFYAGKYYATIHDIVKQIDPNHLFLGWWLVPNWWQNASDWELQEAHVDVLGIDYYNRAFDDPQVMNWIKQSTKPVLIGEFSFPPNFGMTRGFGDYSSSSATPREAGKLYTRWIDATAANPKVLGDCWFEMRDEDIVGRGPGHGPEIVYGENYAFGLVDVTDSPRWPLVDQVREANLQADALREKASAR